MHFVSDHVVYPFSSIDTATAWKKSDWSDFHMINNLSIEAHAFVRRISISLSVNKTLLPRYVNLFTHFRCSPLIVEMSFCLKKHVLCFIYIYIEVNASWLCRMDLAWAGVFAEALDHVHSLRLLFFCFLSSFSVKPFSFIRSLDVQRF